MLCLAKRYFLFYIAHLRKSFKSVFNGPINGKPQANLAGFFNISTNYGDLQN
jgi:hypothetical protein